MVNTLEKYLQNAEAFVSSSEIMTSFISPIIEDGKRKKNLTVKNSFNGDAAYITQLKRQKSNKFAITLASRRHNVNMLLSNSTFLIFTVLVV